MQDDIANPPDPRAEQVRRLLDDELTDVHGVDYELEAMHVGMAAVGEGAAEAARRLSRAQDLRLLLVPGEGGSTWAWLGGRRAPDPAEVERSLAALSTAASIAVGEPGFGLAGWRLTHRQARAALPIAILQDCSVRYADVALLASHRQDDVLRESLRQLYAEPLGRCRNGGRALSETLLAYIACERNVTSTAAKLGVRRHTVASRLRLAEEAIGRPLGLCLPEIEAALRLAELEAANPARFGRSAGGSATNLDGPERAPR